MLIVSSKLSPSFFTLTRALNSLLIVITLIYCLLWLSLELSFSMHIMTLPSFVSLALKALNVLNHFSAFFLGQEPYRSKWRLNGSCYTLRPYQEHFVNFQLAPRCIDWGVSFPLYFIFFLPAPSSLSYYLLDLVNVSHFWIELFILCFM